MTVPAVALEPQELARRIWDHISDNPDEHDQRWWWAEHGAFKSATLNICGTTRCIAGWAVYLAMGTDLMPSSSEYIRSGARLLGLSHTDAHHLFLHTDKKQALEALEYLVKGDPIDWAAMGIPAQPAICLICDELMAVPCGLTA